MYDSQDVSYFDTTVDYDTPLPKFPKPASCEKVNVAGVNDAIEKLIREVEAIKTGITEMIVFLSPLNSQKRCTK